MSGIYYRFIATKTTVMTTIPAYVSSVLELTRRVRAALSANDGGATRVGELRDFPLSSAVPNHLLCDGSEVSKLSFPELYAYLGDTQGVALDQSKFVLPNYVGVATPSPTYPPQQVDTGGTVSTGGIVTEPSEPGQTGGSGGGNVVSGGRPGDGFFNIP